MFKCFVQIYNTNAVNDRKHALPIYSVKSSKL